VISPPDDGANVALVFLLTPCTAFEFPRADGILEPGVESAALAIMITKKQKRWLLAIAALLVLLVAGAIAGLHYASKALKDQVQQALGPESEVGEISVGLSAIVIRDLRVRGPKGWPAEHTLRAKRITVVPDLRGLFSARIRIQQIRVEQAYLSILRARDKRVRLLPSLLEKQDAKSPDGTGPTVAIGSVDLNDGVLEFFDATVRQPAHK
jgi:hypothetical protein